MKKGLIIGFLFILCGCNSFFQTKIDDQLYKKHMTKQFDYSRNKVFKATVEALSEMKTGIQKISTAKGVIITKKTLAHEVATRGGGGVVLNKYWHKYYIKVKGNNSKSIVKVYRYRVWENNKEMDRCFVSWNKENLWDPFFNEINEKLEEL